MKTLIIENKYDGKKLNTILLKEFPYLSVNSIYKALRKKDIKLNGNRIKDNIILHSGDELNIYIPDSDFNSNKNTQNLNIEKIYEDDNILIVNKPVSIEVTGDNSLTSILSNIYNKDIYPCHRLDRNTTGLVIFAKNIDSQNILFNKFKTHEIEKKYLARVYGIPKEKHKILNSFLFKDTKKSLVYINDSMKKGYQKIITEYKILSSDKTSNTSILEITLHTGKTHQIRAHLSHIGFPIIGDGKYGINDINKQFKAKYQNLCSYKLKFNFSTPSGILSYLNNMEIILNNLPKY